MRIALTGGIACGKSLTAKYLGEFGVETLDADDIVHEILPDPAERRRIAAEVFGNEKKRKELEAKIHPLVAERLEAWAAEKTGRLKVEIIPLLFETHWEGKYDIICTLRSERTKQIERMIETRGYMLEEAERRLGAQMAVSEKAARSQYVIDNDGSAEELREKVAKFVEYLKERS